MPGRKVISLQYTITINHLLKSIKHSTSSEIFKYQFKTPKTARFYLQKETAQSYLYSILLNQAAAKTA